MTNLIVTLEITDNVFHSDEWRRKKILMWQEYVSGLMCNGWGGNVFI